MKQLQLGIADLIEVEQNIEPESEYQPLSSIWEGTDEELLEKMLDFYPRKRPQLILDATVNAGRFWKGSSRPVIGMDIDPAHRPNIIGSHTLSAFPFSNG